MARLYAETIRVPLILVSPRVNGAMLSNDPAGTIDIAPTVLELLGMAPESTFEGTSLFDNREIAISQRIDNIIQQSIENRKYKLIIAYMNGKENYELFDKTEDSLEMFNLAGKPGYDEILNGLRRHAVALSERCENVAIDAESKQRLNALGYVD
jgi:arylsulfatase A-like enzyme